MHAIETAVQSFGSDPFSPWETVMARGTAAARQGQWMLALASFQQALGMARALLAARPAGRSEDCVAALIVSHHNLAELQTDAGGPDLAAACSWRRPTKP